MAEEQSILFGAGEIFIVPDDIDVDSATDEEIEDALVKIGESSGEATLNYSGEFADVRGGKHNQILASFMTSESTNFNCGVVTFDLSKISEFLPGFYNEEEDADGNVTERTLGLGGKTSVPVKQLRFVHEKRQDGKDIYVDMWKAQNRSGLEMTFSPEAESVFNMEFTLLADDSKSDGNIVRITEEL
ncbi:hypothetical protein [Alteribacillus sp. YIM 98480]|uniref:hypothetical protein n=1 Tax=Alteribacillus sp. YIM 98480 TaxID=2606599 RepID=UPI00131AC0BE|nr:hypothetical protein [Alteribacillus sp. YIM 98480]